MAYQPNIPNYLGFAQAWPIPDIAGSIESGVKIGSQLQQNRRANAAEKREQELFPAKLAMDNLLVERAKEELEAIRRTNDIAEVLQSTEITKQQARIKALDNDNLIADLEQTAADKQAALQLRKAIAGNLDLHDDINALEASDDVPKVYETIMRLRDHELYKTNPAFRKAVVEGERRVRALPAVTWASGGDPMTGEQVWQMIEKMQVKAAAGAGVNMKPGEDIWMPMNFESMRGLSPGEAAMEGRLAGLSPEARATAIRGEELKAKELNRAVDVRLAEMELDDPEKAARKRGEFVRKEKEMAERTLARNQEAIRIGVNPIEHRRRRDFEAALRQQIEDIADSLGDDAFDENIFKGIGVHVGDAAMLREAAQLMTHPVKGHIGQGAALAGKLVFGLPQARRSKSAMNLGGALRGITQRIYRPISEKDQVAAMKELGDIMEALRNQTHGPFETERREYQRLQAEKQAVITETSGTTSEASRLYDDILQGSLDASANSQPVTIKFSNGKVVTTTMAVAMQLRADGKTFEFVSGGAE